MDLVGLDVVGARIGPEVIAAVCRDLAAAPEVGSSWWVSIGIDDDRSLDAALSAQVVLALEAASIDAARLVIEVPERIVARPEARRPLLSLAEHGVRVAVSDFGSGWSSLRQLRSLPVEVARLDPSLAVKPRRGSVDVLMATIALARAYGISTVASGVEDGEDLLLLALAECDLATGPWWGHPASFQEISDRFGSSDGSTAPSEPSRRDPPSLRLLVAEP